jgi:hypothetical protein
VKKLLSPFILSLPLVLLAIWLPRGLALDRFATVDEPRWLTRSANFYQALSQGEYRFTFQKEHPGVTITWAGMAGFFWRFRSYIDVRPGQIERPGRLHLFLRNRNLSSLDLLVAGRIFVVLGITTALVLAYGVAARLVGVWSAAFIFLLVAFDPFSVALSRLLHLDGLLSALILLSLLAFFRYEFHGRRKLDLLLAAVAGGFAWLTKSPAFFLAPFFGLVILIHWWTEQQSIRQGVRSVVRSLWKAFVPLAVWFGIAAVVFVAFWPAMWVDPWEIISRVFSLASTYASEGHDSRLFFAGTIFDIGQSPWYFYPVAFIWRTSPVVLIGLGLSLLAILFPRRFPLSVERRRLAGLLLLFSILFAVFLSLSAKKFDRYLLPVFAPLDLVAGLGWLSLGSAFTGFVRHRTRLSTSWITITLLGLVVCWQLAGVLQTYPYYFNYYNPLLGGDRKAPEMMLIGWGEGLDQAARYLNQKPGAEDMKVFSWSADGCFSYFYKGSAGTIDYDMSVRDLRRANYVVFYINQLQRQAPSRAVLAYFAQFEPEYVVKIGNLEYARVYNMEDAPPLSAFTGGNLDIATVSANP